MEWNQINHFDGSAQTQQNKLENCVTEKNTYKQQLILFITLYLTTQRY